MVLGALGGKPLSSSASGVLTVTAMVAVGVSLVLAALHRSRPALLPLLCAATLAALLWLTLRGWRGLQRRPHPFLANAP
jgi:threonine/homoserine/homoserine lactone efflux protein